MFYEVVLVEVLFEQDYQQITTGKRKQLNVILTKKSDLLLKVTVNNRLKQLHHTDHPTYPLKMSGLN